MNIKGKKWSSNARLNLNGSHPAKGVAPASSRNMIIFLQSTCDPNSHSSLTIDSLESINEAINAKKVEKLSKESKFGT